MKLSIRKNHLYRNKFRLFVVILILFLVIFEAECIKFGRKQTEKKPASTTQNTNSPPTENPNNNQNILPKQTQQHVKDDSKPLKQPEQPKVDKPSITVVPTPSAVPEKQQKPKAKSSTDQTLDTLFGKSQQSKNKQPSQTAENTATPQQHKVKTTSVPQTIATAPSNTQTQQKVSQPNNMIGHLFGMEKSTKPKKVETTKQEISNPFVTTKVQPLKQSSQVVNSKSQILQTSVKPQQSQEVKSVDGPKSQSDKQNKAQTKQLSHTKDISDKKDAQVSNEKEAITQKKTTTKTQEQSSGDVYYPSNSKKKVKKFVSPKVQQKNVEVTKAKDQASSTDQQTHAKQQSSSIQEQSQSEQIIYPKNMNKANKKSKDKTSLSIEQNPEDAKQKYSLTLFFTFCLYSLIIVLVVITIKCTSSSSKVVKAVSIMIDAMGDMFKKKQGYRPALNQQEVTQREQQITVGYNVEDNNKQIFWQKNSVEGI